MSQNHPQGLTESEVSQISRQEDPVLLVRHGQVSKGTPKMQVKDSQVLPPKRRLNESVGTVLSGIAYNVIGSDLHLKCST